MLAGSSCTQTISRALGCSANGGGDFRPRQRIKLVEEENRGAGVFAAAAFGTKFVANLSAGDQDALGVLNFVVRHERQKRGRVKSSMFELASGWRNMLLGVKTISGLRHTRRACRRSM